MSPHTMNYIYYITIGIVGLIMYTSPHSFVFGKVKYDENAVKTESFFKKTGLVIMVACTLLTIYNFFFHTNA